VTLTHEQIFEHYIYAGSVARNPDAVADMFTEDGILEAPLVPDGHALRRLVGRDAIRSGVGAYHQRESARSGTVNFAESRYVLHDTVDPDVFIAEIDTVLDGADGQRTTMSLVQIVRVRDGLIAVLRDYFAEPSELDGRAGQR
jgi:ketosteroid isomerase-like protein